MNLLKADENAYGRFEIDIKNAISIETEMVFIRNKTK